ncbi:unnamed protein product [Closterium sp. NIES-64]|nr:unnamed protein product [Closterium sp. NIES-64]
MIGSGQVLVRPGVLELMDEVRQRVRGGMWVEEEEGERGGGKSKGAVGLLVAVCSAATKSSVVFQVDSIFSPHSPTSPPVPRLSSPLLPPVLPPLSFGLLVAVCSAATKSSVVFTLTSLLGKVLFIPPRSICMVVPQK